jgi:site-specific recombinase XerD
MLGVGRKAVERFVTFFTDNIRNPHTRRAYHKQVLDFFAWCDLQRLDFARIKSFHVSAYIESLLAAGKAKPSVKQGLAAIRTLYDWLIIGQVCEINPAQAVRGPKHVVKKGKTPVLDDEQIRDLYAGIDTSHLVGLRDRALISIMLFTFGRVGAVSQMHVEDYYPGGKRWYVRLHEKGGKEHEMPAHSKLEEHLDAYIKEAGIADDKKGPLFRTTYRRTQRLTDNRVQQPDVWRMIRRRARDAGILTPIGCHSFRATGITNYLRHRGTLEKAQRMANHESARTTGLYDHSGDELTAEEIQKVWWDGI